MKLFLCRVPRKRHRIPPAPCFKPKTTKGRSRILIPLQRASIVWTSSIVWRLSIPHDALLGWGLVPHLQDGELVIDGMDALDAESRAGLERWLAHAGPNGEPRQERVIRALKTGRRCAA